MKNADSVHVVHEHGNGHQY